MVNTYEPPRLEVFLTLIIGKTLLTPYYRSFAQWLNLDGDEKVLDFGSGSGVCSRHIAARLQKGGQLDCLDISVGWQAVIQKTLRRFENINYHLGSLTDVDLKDNYYDIVVIHYVMHDIQATDRLLILKTIAKKLKPGGRLVIREPQGHGLLMKDLENLTQLSGLKKVALYPQKIVIGEAIDGIFTKNE